MMKYIKKFNESINLPLMLDYKTKFNEIKSRATKELQQLKDETTKNVEDSILYIIDNYDYNKDSRHDDIHSMFDEWFTLTYNITLTHKDVQNKSEVIDNFKSAFDKLLVNTGHKFPSTEQDENYLKGDDIRFYTKSNHFHCFDDFEKYINDSSIRNRVVITLSINMSN